MKPQFLVSKSQQGFVSSLFIAVLNVILLTGFIYAYINFYIQQKDYVRRICLYEFKEIQTLIVHSEERILKLNPLSTALRLRMTQLKLALAAAVATSNFSLIAQINIQIMQTYQQQQRLEELQRTLMLQANLNLRRQFLNMDSRISSHIRSQMPAWKHFLLLSTLFSLKPIHSLPLEPDSIGGTAPNYELKPNYSKLQMLALNWNQSIQTKLGIKSSFNNQTQCSLTGKKEGSAWHIEINPDRF